MAVRGTGWDRGLVKNADGQARQASWATVRGLTPSHPATAGPVTEGLEGVERLSGAVLPSGKSSPAQTGLRPLLS